MKTKILFIGLDVDDKNFHGYALYEGEDQGIAFKTKATISALKKAVEQFVSPETTIQFCYESTYCGFHLCRSLQKAGFECTVIASSLIPELSSHKVKNDRLDAEKLSRYFSKGLLTAVYMPDEVDEQNRSLVRSRTFLKEQVKEVKRHMVSICKQIGWSYREEAGEGSAYWTTTHQAWLKRMIAQAPAVTKLNFELLLSHLIH